MPTNVQITRQTGDEDRDSTAYFDLKFTADEQSWYSLSWKLAGENEFSDYNYYSSQAAAQTQYSFQMSRPDYLGTNQIRLRIMNASSTGSATFFGYMSPVSFSVPS